MSAGLDRAAPPLPASIVAARAAIASLAARLLAIPDAALDRPWSWRDVENKVRYGLYRAAETIEAASAELAREADSVRAAAEADA